MILGIDPGVTGAIVALNNDGTMHKHIPMPALKTDTDKRSRIDGSQIKLTSCASTKASAIRLRLSMLVQCQMTAPPMPSMSGHGCGVIEGVLQALEIPYTKVRPQAWKKVCGLIGKDKGRGQAGSHWSCTLN